MNTHTPPTPGHPPTPAAAGACAPGQRGLRSGLGLQARRGKELSRHKNCASSRAAESPENRLSNLKAQPDSKRSEPELDNILNNMLVLVEAFRLHGDEGLVEAAVIDGIDDLASHHDA